jgi:hypothetical protein
VSGLARGGLDCGCFQGKDLELKSCGRYHGRYHDRYRDRHGMVALEAEAGARGKEQQCRGQ